MRSLAVLGVIVCVSCVVSPPARAVGADVDVQLVLAVDISRSMDYDELGVQRQGYVAAFRNPEVINAITGGGIGRIAVTYLEWAGAFYQKVIVPWRIIAGRDDAEAFATALDAAPITREMGTSISGGLLFAARQFAESKVTGLRRTIDVSGDGANNIGAPVAPVRDQLVDEGITINGLPIIIRPSTWGGPFDMPDLDVYYRDCVIGGPGSFMITVDDIGRFEVAVRRKLVLEVAGLAPRVMLAADDGAPSGKADCLAGEKARRRYLDPLFR